MSGSTHQATWPGIERTVGTAEFRRIILLLFVFVLWAAVIVARLAQSMILRGPSTLAAMTRESVQDVFTPALRGRLLDRDGRPLAWSTRHVALVWEAPADAALAAARLEDIRRCVGDLTLTAAAESSDSLLGRTVTLADDLMPASVVRLDAVCRAIPGLRLDSYFVRHVHALAAQRIAIGTVMLVDGHEVGVSGAEKMHDSLLRGRPGAYRVMRNQSGEWIPESWQELRATQPGHDVHLPMRLATDGADASS